MRTSAAHLAPPIPLLLLVSALGCTVSGDPAVESRVAAEGHYRQGRELWQRRSPSGLLESRKHFEAAVDADPEYAAAWAGLADASALLGLYSVLPARETMPRARQAAERALELDPGLALAHASLGLALYLHDWDYAAAEESLRRALQLDPEYATAAHWLAMMLSATGRHDEAVATMRHALELDPDSRIINIKLITVLSAAGAFRQAEAQLERCLERWSDVPLLHREAGFLALRRAWAEGAAEPEQAIEAFERAAELDGGGDKVSGGLGHAYAVAGRTEDAEGILEQLRRSDREGEAPPIYVALVLAGLERPSEALDWLEEAEARRDPGLVYLWTKPGLEALYEEPRFLALSERLGLLPRPSTPTADAS